MAPRGQRDMSLPEQEWRFEVGRPEHAARLDLFLAQRLTWRSRGGIHEAIRSGRVGVLPFKDPQKASVGRLRPATRLRRGQEVVVRLPSAQAEVTEDSESSKPVAAAPAPEVVFEDDHLIVVAKDPFHNVYPSRRHRQGSLIEWVHARHRERNGSGGYFPTPCHRLDRETSGLVLFAKDRRTRSEIGEKLETCQVAKTYLAVVEGVPLTDTGVVALPLARDGGSRVEIKRGPRESGQPALTRWTVRRRFSAHALLEVRPETGRQHQIRVHLAAIGHPIVGDKLYLGGDELFLRWLEDELTVEDLMTLKLPRQALHAWRLALELDSSGPVDLEAPIPADMLTLFRTFELGVALC